MCIWMRDSNTVVILSADQAKLDELASRGEACPFVDPDLGEEISSLALDPGPVAKKICRGLRLLGA